MKLSQRKRINSGSSNSNVKHKKIQIKRIEIPQWKQGRQPRGPGEGSIGCWNVIDIGNMCGKMAFQE